MKKIGLAVVFLMCFLACKEVEKSLTAQEIVDKSIAVSGGDFLNKSRISFRFRDAKYVAERNDWRYQLERIKTDSLNTVRDVVNNDGFSRYVNEKPVTVADSMASRYSNSVNSVHYFAYLPYGLNDKAVNKELLGEATIKGKAYHKIKVTFDQEGGGDDFEDVYLYWIDKTTFTMDYLAYEFHVNGGGLRFREAYNIRTVNGIRFVDYHNFKPKTKNTEIYDLDQLFENGELELLSEIILEDVEVSPCKTC